MHLNKGVRPLNIERCHTTFKCGTFSSIVGRPLLIIIGAGAAGFFSAIHNKRNNPDSTVIILEKTPNILSKVKISGGGRCNVTHACFEPKELCRFYPRGSKELLGPFYSFQCKDTMDWFESRGVPLKIEKDNRVFPYSDSSQSIIDCLVKEAEALGVQLCTSCSVEKIEKDKLGFRLSLENGDTLTCDKLILATGSSREGHRFAKSLGHKIVEPIPSLFTFKISDPSLHKRSGLSVENVEVWLGKNKKQSQSGPLLVTHWGFSGPAIIKLSAWQARTLFNTKYQEDLHIDWLPVYDKNDLLQLFIQERTDNGKKQVCKRSPHPEIAGRLWDYLCQKAGVGDVATWQSLNERQVETLISELKAGHFDMAGKSPFKDEFVTCGGVSLKEVNFKTMESKVCANLHLVGELLNIDGVTGGFNFQNAWTTGYLSGGFQ